MSQSPYRRRRNSEWRARFCPLIERTIAEVGRDDPLLLRARLRQVRPPETQSRYVHRQWAAEVRWYLGAKPLGHPQASGPAGQGWLF